MITHPVRRRGLAPLVLALTLLALIPGQALAARFDISGTVIAADEDKMTFVIVTSDVIGKEQPITVDMSGLPRIFRATGVGSPISLTIESREFDTYLATGLVSEGSYVNRETLGAREEFEVKNESVKAHVGNVKDDDEADAQLHRGSDLKPKPKNDESNQ